MKTEKLKQGINYSTSKKNYTKSRMYEFDFSTDIMVEEKQADGTIDQTILRYVLNEKEKAYFSEEYLPAGMKKEGIKKPDITAIIENPVNKKLKWFIYDMKDTLKSTKVAMKLCSQWHEGIEHIGKEYLETKAEYQIEDSVGAVTRCLDVKRLQDDVEGYKKKIGNSENESKRLLTARKSLQNETGYRERIRCGQNIIDGIFDDYDEDSGEKKQYKIHYIELAKESDVLYRAYMDIKI